MRLSISLIAVWLSTLVASCEGTVVQEGQVVINEVASKGAFNVCGGNADDGGKDYIELVNLSSNTADIGGYILQDDKPSSFTIPTGTKVQGNGFILFCKDAVGSFTFGIGGTDTVTLFDAAESQLSTTGKLLDEGSTVLSYQRRPDGSFAYSLPSPDAVNLFFSPFAGIVVVNEAADKAVAGTCNGEDYVELFNTGDQSVNLEGYILHDDKGPDHPEAFTFPTGNSIGPGGFILLCGDGDEYVNGFKFGIGSTDTVTLADPNGAFVSTTGELKGEGSATSSYQRTNAGEYSYSLPTPGQPNAFQEGQVVINEVASKGAFNVCGGNADDGGKDYIELVNLSSNTADIGGYILQDDKPSSFTIPTGTKVQGNGFILFCKDAEGSFTFGIGGTDTVTLFDATTSQLSTTGKLLDKGSTVLSYQRRPDGSFAYSLPSPDAVNLFYSQFAGIVVVNEAADKGVAGTCNGEDYVELFNTGDQSVDLSGFLLVDNNGPSGSDAFTFPTKSVIEARQILLYCGDADDSFQFGIGGDDAVTLLDTQGDIVSATGALSGKGSSTLTYQRTDTGAYAYAFPTPGATNVFSGGVVVINEVAAAGSSDTAWCTGLSFIELYNDGESPLDLTGFVLYNEAGSTGAGAYTFPNGLTIQRREFAVLCSGDTFSFEVGKADTVSINNADGEMVATSGSIGGDAPRPNAINLTWARVVDLLNPLDPIDPFYQYSEDPTPGSANIFSFEPVQLDLQACGVQTEPFGRLADYEFKDKLLLNIDRNPELSGGSFDGRTCTNLFIGDEGNINEVAISRTDSSVNLVRTVPVIGGSQDTEGSCFWYDSENGDKLVITDERDRSVAICDIPAADQVVPLFRDSSNCRVIKLTPDQFNDPLQTSTDPNLGFEGVACDPYHRKLYVIQEKSPMRVWSVDVDTGTYTVLIDVQNLEAWTSRVTDLAGGFYDPFSETLYLLSHESKVIVHTTMDGTILGDTLDVSMAIQPEGLSFVPSTGELVVLSEPNEILRFTLAAPIALSHSVCESFAVHARTTVTFDGALTTIHGGDVSVSPGTSITGAYRFDGGEQVDDSAVFAASVVVKHAAAMEVRADGIAIDIEIGGKIFTPGTYRSDSAINFAYGTRVTLDGLNQANPVFLFQAGSTLVTAANTHFFLMNGAKAENVLWALGTAATLGARSVVEGSILAGTAITFGTESELRGCALAQSAVTFESEGSIDLNDRPIEIFRHLRGLKR